MKANIMEKAIEMNKIEANAAGKLNSKAFTELKELRAAYPGFKIVVKTTTKTRDNLKGLNIPFMVKYIKAHDNEGKTIMGDFNALRGCNEDGSKDEEAESLSYGELKQWFLEKYPEVANMNRAAIILATRKAA